LRAWCFFSPFVVVVEVEVVAPADADVGLDDALREETIVTGKRVLPGDDRPPAPRKVARAALMRVFSGRKGEQKSRAERARG